jgi:hypothetical protein
MCEALPRGQDVLCCAQEENMRRDKHTLFRDSLIVTFRIYVRLRIFVFYAGSYYRHRHELGFYCIVRVLMRGPRHEQHALQRLKCTLQCSRGSES